MRILLETLPPEVLDARRDDFAFGSLSRVYGHIAECYLLWLSRGGVGQPERDLRPRDPAGLREAFARVGHVKSVEPLEGEGRLRVYPEGGHSLVGALATLIRDKGWAVEELREEIGRLDEVFRTVTLTETVKEA